VRVFVSYASQDRAFAQRLVGDLQAAGAEVWWDVSGIDEGDFLDKINQALQHCQWLVLVLTPNAVASKWVNSEVNAAIHRRQQGFMHGVLPVLAAPVQPGTVPPMWDNLHRYDAVRDYAGEVARLLQTLGHAGQSTESPPAQPVIPPRLANLGYRVAVQGGAEVILPPLCAVPAGRFLMGTDPNKDKAALKEEHPQHWVTLGAFEIGKYPVTVAEYACFVRASGTAAPTGDDSKWWQVSWQTQLRERLEHPIVMVSWHDATAYAQWLAEHTGQPWRLPSEEEWEKAARWDAATGSARIYPWGDNFDTARCNTYEAGKGTTTPIGSHPSGASPYGVLDMAGNVYEWTSSEYKDYPALPPYTDHVQRGAAWSTEGARGARVAYRFAQETGLSRGDSGFRLVRGAPVS
jgi:formylglycine-generating enzyme required for sulfatase activity